MGLNKVYIKITRENIYKDEFCIKKSLSPTHTDLFGHKVVRLQFETVQLCFSWDSRRSSNLFIFQTPVTRISWTNEGYRTTFCISA